MKRRSVTDRIMLPVLATASGGIVAILVAGLVGFSPLELALPMLGGAFGHFLNSI